MKIRRIDSPPFMSNFQFLDGTIFIPRGEFLRDFTMSKMLWPFFNENIIVSPALLSISSLYGFTISILQIRWRTLWMVQTDAYRSPEVGSVVFYPLELVGHFAVRGSQIGESWFFWLYFRNFKITPKLSLGGPFWPNTLLLRIKWAFQRYIRIMYIFENYWR